MKSFKTVFSKLKNHGFQEGLHGCSGRRAAGRKNVSHAKKEFAKFREIRDPRFGHFLSNHHEITFFDEYL